MTKEKFSIRSRIRSFKYAFNGIIIMLRDDHNGRIHLFAAACAIVAGYFFKISVYEWLAIVLAIGMVISLEIVNSSVEKLADFVSPDKHEVIKRVKDLSSAAVLVGAIAAFVIGLLIFIPKILALC